MRCAVGDLCIVICAGDVPAMQDRFVEVIATGDPYLGLDAWTCRGTSGPVHGWALTARWNFELVEGETVDIPDAWLRPIRDGEGADETLTWAPKPEPETYAFG